MIKKITIFVFLFTYQLAFGQGSKMDDLINKAEEVVLKNMIEKYYGGKLKNSGDIEIYGTKAKSYVYELKNWRGPGKCKFISYYVAKNQIIGYEFFYEPSVSKFELLKEFENNKFLNEEKLDANGIPAIKYVFLETKNNLIMTLSAYASNPNGIVILTFHRDDWNAK